MTAIYTIAFIWIAINAAILARVLWVDWVKAHRHDDANDYSGEWRA